MSCGEHFDTGSCVCDVLAQIADEQNDSGNGDCLGSCNQSIRELMGGVTPSNFNTVPFQLICTTASTSHGASSPDVCGTVFQATGYRRIPHMPNVIEKATSTFFRVTSINQKTGCAILELLCAEEHGGKGKDGKGDGKGKGKGECIEEFELELERTGICITIDCTCFCGIVCLPAMALPRA